MIFYKPSDFQPLTYHWLNETLPKQNVHDQLISLCWSKFIAISKLVTLSTVPEQNKLSKYRQQGRVVFLPPQHSDRYIRGFDNLHEKFSRKVCLNKSSSLALQNTSLQFLVASPSFQILFTVVSLKKSQFPITDPRDSVLSLLGYVYYFGLLPGSILFLFSFFVL